ncbi:MAG: hypothetical protein HKM98_01615 [Gammaproteobacteria bacterium]|nr:hypothetical protein [Gammaproteobacteria bacterium]
MPRSEFLLGLVIALHIGVYFAGMILLEVGPQRTLALPLLDTVTQAVLFSLVLVFMQLKDRIVQSLTAVFGADVLLNLLSIPLALMSSASIDSAAGSLPALAAIVVLLWSLGVKGHILQRATGFPYFVGVVIALGFYIAVLMIDNSLFGSQNG